MDDALITALSAFGGLLILALAAELGGRPFRAVVATIVAAMSLVTVGGYLHLASLRQSIAVARTSTAPQTSAVSHSATIQTHEETRTKAIAQTEAVPRIETIARTDAMPPTVCVRQGTVPACSCVARP